VFLLPIPLRKQNFRSSCLYFPGVFDIYFVWMTFILVYWHLFTDKIYIQMQHSIFW
jgi:capsule polysaccharide export protein KpsE/RkpR